MTLTIDDLETMRDRRVKGAREKTGDENHEDDRKLVEEWGIDPNALDEICKAAAMTSVYTAHELYEGDLIKAMTSTHFAVVAFILYAIQQQGGH